MRINKDARVIPEMYRTLVLTTSKREARRIRSEGCLSRGRGLERQRVSLEHGDPMHYGCFWRPTRATRGK